MQLTARYRVADDGDRCEISRLAIACGFGSVSPMQLTARYRVADDGDRCEISRLAIACGFGSKSPMQLTARYRVAADRFAVKSGAGDSHRLSLRITNANNRTLSRCG